MREKIKRIAKKVIGETSDVLSAPSRIVHGMRASQADRDLMVIKMAREFRGSAMPRFEGGMATPRMKAESAYDALVDRKKRARK